MCLLMIKVITYGSFDLLHYGHIKLLKRAKALGDYLIVGVTSDDYDKARGKINLSQSLMERVESVKATQIADEIIVEEYEGQKIDDIQKYDIDIFTVGSDWEGVFDYLEEYCKVIYLPRTNGISSSEIREENRHICLGLVGESLFLNKVWKESKFVNGVTINSLCSNNIGVMKKKAIAEFDNVSNKIEHFLGTIDAAYVRSLPEEHYIHIKKLLEAGKDVLYESPLTLNIEQAKELLNIASAKGLILMEAVKTAYSTAYSRLLLLIKSGVIGNIVSVDVCCTSLKEKALPGEWRCIHEWGPTGLLPILHILGTEFKDCNIVSRINEDGSDNYTHISILYEKAIGTMRIGDGVKSEGELIVSGTKGYIYVPAPWWKTEYFEVRYENPNNNKRYFYQLDGEGIRYELVAFARAIERRKIDYNISCDITLKIVEIMEQFGLRQNVVLI